MYTNSIKFLSIVLLILTIFFNLNCYTKIKSEDKRFFGVRSRNIKKDIPEDTVKWKPYKLTPEKSSNIQIQYFWIDSEKSTDFIVQITFQGDVEKYAINGNILELLWRIDRDSILYEDLLIEFNKSGFIESKRTSFAPKMWPSSGVNILFRSEPDAKFKKVSTRDLGQSQKKYPKIFIDLFHKLLIYAKDHRYRKNR